MASMLPHGFGGWDEIPALSGSKKLGLHPRLRVKKTGPAESNGTLLAPPVQPETLRGRSHISVQSRALACDSAMQSAKPQDGMDAGR